MTSGMQTMIDRSLGCRFWKTAAKKCKLVIFCRLVEDWS